MSSNQVDTSGFGAYAGPVLRAQRDGRDVFLSLWNHHSNFTEEAFRTFNSIPGRVGDSPILGAGLYVDGEVGAAGSTGRGEANIYSLASFLVVEQMRGGARIGSELVARARLVDEKIELLREIAVGSPWPSRKEVTRN